ncbi:MAG: hypothetical protein Q6K80_11030 [Thermostichus sp. DG_1_6_bins_120]
MVWQQVEVGVWYTHLGRLAPQWWLGWSFEKGFQLYCKEAPVAVPLKIVYQDQDRWLDVFLGEAEHHPQRRRSLLDPTARVALHYLEEDLARIGSLECPDERIPPELWQRLVARVS